MAKAAKDSETSSGTSAPSISRRLDKALSKVDRPGTFSASGSMPVVLPGLEVKGVGPIGLPLTGPQLKVLKGRSEQAPYGKGEQTLVDTKVRRVWRLTPEAFSLTNPAWGTFLDEVVTKVQAGLGLEVQKLEAHLYDLLLYEAGSFFLPHRDGEKLDRMVATLVVGLPSKFTGGELLVRHEGQEQKIDFAGPDSLFRINYAAFYADCEHEVRPVRSGYRLCLVYNLTLAKSKKGLGAPRSGEHVARLAGILSEWDQDEAAPPKLAVTLGHQYTKDGLTWDALKGVDGAKAQVLAEAARQAGCRVYLALLTFWESGSAEEEYDDYRSRRGYGRSRRHWDEEEEEEDDGSVEGGHTMTEVYDRSLSAEGWVGPDGDASPFGVIPVQENEIVPPESLKAVKPQENYEGYTGNEGMTLERWYRHGAVFLWPEGRHLDVLLQAGSRSAVPVLQRLIAAWKAAEGPEAGELKSRCLTFAGKILAKWPEQPLRRAYPVWRAGREEAADRPDPMPLLGRLDDPDLLRRYFRETLVRDASLDPAEAAVKAVVRHGWEAFRPELQALFQATTGETIERNVTFLGQLGEAAGAAPGGDGKAKRAEREDGAAARETCRLLAQTAVAALVRLDTKRDVSDWRAGEIDRAKLLPALARVLLAARLDDMLGRVVEHVLKDAIQYPLRPVQLPALAGMAAWLRKHPGHAPAALSRWLTVCREQLESLTAAEPQPPPDFRRDADFPCRTADCEAMKKFLLDPLQQEARFQMAQDRRRDMENLIRHHHLDVTFATDKRPRPQVLVCTKTTASYERKLKQYQDDLKHLAAVRSMEPAAAGS